MSATGPGVGAGADAERLRRWRLVLGAAAEAEVGGLADAAEESMDAALAAVYDRPDPTATRGGGLGGSAPRVARWLGDVRTYFPSRVVQIMQRDAVERLGITRLLLEPEVLSGIEPDVHLVGTLLTLSGAIPEQTRATARAVVGRVVEDIERRIATSTRSAVTGALNRAARTTRPRPGDIDWGSTIRANLRHYLPEHRTVVPETLIGFGRRRQSIRKDLILALDQSGSMASSIVHAAVFGSVLASLPALRTSVVVFDTAVVDLTDRLDDPVDLLFSVQLGGGTDINRAIAYCQSLIQRPRDSIFVLVSDLFEGGVREQILRRIRQMVADGVTVIVLLALSDEGAPAFDRENAAALGELGVAAFACTPDNFPELLAAALDGSDLQRFVEREQRARQ